MLQPPVLAELLPPPQRLARLRRVQLRLAPGQAPRPPPARLLLPERLVQRPLLALLQPLVRLQQQVR
jgi:hypothetical protein